MTGRTHNAIAFASLVTVAVINPPANLNVLTFVGCIVAADIGALFPDMDQAGNDLWNLLPATHSLGGILKRIFYKHRTITHSLVGLFLIFKFLQWLLPKFLNPIFLNPNLILISFLVGYISHLVADSFTEEGLPLLFPINITFGIPPIKSWRIKTGHWFENLIIYPAVWIYLIWFIRDKVDVVVKILKIISS